MAHLTSASGQEIYSGGVILLPHGLGKLYHPSGNLKYSGTFLDNQYHGKGELYSADGKPQVRGEWSNGKKNGYCKVYAETGKLASIGNFLEDIPTGDHFATFHESGYIKNYGLVGEDGEFCPEKSYEFDSTGKISRLPQLSDEEKSKPENGLYSLSEEDFEHTQWGACVLEIGSPP
jgi:antitoxin component YwqK of YwqJK toxin-antitoxin module